MVELRYSKEQILEFYLNQIYLGQRGSWSVCGVEEASLYYFNKHAQELTVPEAALIVGSSPRRNRFSPYRDAEAAIVRRNEVLQDMAEAGYITKQDARKYRRTQMRFAANPPPATLGARTSSTTFGRRSPRTSPRASSPARLHHLHHARLRAPGRRRRRSSVAASRRRTGDRRPAAPSAIQRRERSSRSSPRRGTSAP
jgi:hypothetical protein